MSQKKKSDVLSGCALPVASEEFVIEAGLGIVEETTEMPPPNFDSLIELCEIRSKHAVN